MDGIIHRSFPQVNAVKYLEQGLEIIVHHMGNALSKLTLQLFKGILFILRQHFVQVLKIEVLLYNAGGGMEYFFIQTSCKSKNEPDLTIYQ